MYKNMMIELAKVEDNDNLVCNWAESDWIEITEESSVGLDHPSSRRNCIHTDKIRDLFYQKYNLDHIKKLKSLRHGHTARQKKVSSSLIQIVS